MRRAERAAALVLLAGLAAGLGTGCVYVAASGAFGPDLDPAVIARIEPGTTTKGEVLALLGPPEEYLRSEVLEALGDETTRVRNAIALGNRAHDALSWQRDRLEARGNLLLVYNRARVDFESDLLVVFFDAEDRVREVSFRTVQGRP